MISYFPVIFHKLRFDYNEYFTDESKAVVSQNFRKFYKFLIYRGHLKTLSVVWVHATDIFFDVSDIIGDRHPFLFRVTRLIFNSIFKIF